MIEIGFGLYFLTLFLIYLVMVIKESKSSNQLSYKIKDLRVSKKKMVEDVLQWCLENHPSKKKRNQLYFKIHYYEHKKMEGKYCGSNNRISIYITPEKKIIDIVDTILHEYQHHIEIRTKKDLKIYFKQLESFGYDNHPMEISARKFAKENREDCFNTFKRNWL